MSINCLARSSRFATLSLGKYLTSRSMRTVNFRKELSGFRIQTKRMLLGIREITCNASLFIRP